MSLHAELGSIASSLDGLTERITRLAEELAGSPEEDLAFGLIDVERHLRSGSRRLERVLREISPKG